VILASGFPNSSSCFFRSSQPNFPQHVAAIPSSMHTNVLQMVTGVRSKLGLQLVFDCKDQAGNSLQSSGMTTARVVSLLLAARVSSSATIWCCNQNDVIIPVSQDVRDSSFIASASLFLAGNNFLVPAVISTGKHTIEVATTMN